MFQSALQSEASARKHDVTPNAFYGWKEKFLEAGKLALAGSPKNGPCGGLDAESFHVQRIHKCTNHPNFVILLHVLVQHLWQKQFLPSIIPLNKNVAHA